MDYQEYLDHVRRRFHRQAGESRVAADVALFYEEEFRWRWIATKLKISSYVAYFPEVDRQLMREYTEFWYEYTGKHRKGLPRGWQNGDVVNAVAVTSHANDAAIAYATERPAKHFSSFEYPILMDLSTGKLHYYRGEILWGKMYTNYMRGYIPQHFGLHG